MSDVFWEMVQFCEKYLFVSYTFRNKISNFIIKFSFAPLSSRKSFHSSLTQSYLFWRIFVDRNTGLSDQQNESHIPVLHSEPRWPYSPTFYNASPAMWITHAMMMSRNSWYKNLIEAAILSNIKAVKLLSKSSHFHY